MTESVDDLFDPWFEAADPGGDRAVVLKERDDGREEVFSAFVSVVADHLVDLSVIERMGGFESAAHVLRNRLPDNKKARSGDLGEILATEYVERKTEFRIFIRRLRYKDDRISAMRGDDVLGFRETQDRVQVIKVEAKSRATLSGTVITSARNGLAKHEGRPNPSTLGFLEYLLREKNRDADAELLAGLQGSPIRAEDIRHLVFTLSGNDPSAYLVGGSTPLIVEDIELRLCGCHVENHEDFVRTVFETCLGLGDADGVE